MYTVTMLLLWNLGNYIGKLETGKSLDDYDKTVQLFIVIMFLFCLSISVSMDLKMINK